MSSIVLTRDALACARYESALAPLAVVPLPVTRTAPPADEGALVRALERGGYAAIVCASARAAEALLLAHRHEPLPEVWAIGPATARVLAAARLAVLAPPGVTDATSLAHALVAHLAARGLAAPRVLVPRAQEGRDEGLAILRAAGADVVDVAAYRTVATAADEPALTAGLARLARPVDDPEGAVACALFAPSQVTALAALVDLGALTTPLVAIGETTAAALRDAGARIAATATAPTPEGLANAIAAVYPPRA